RTLRRWFVLVLLAVRATAVFLRLFEQVDLLLDELVLELLPLQVGCSAARPPKRRARGLPATGSTQPSDQFLPRKPDTNLAEIAGGTSTLATGVPPALGVDVETGRDFTPAEAIVLKRLSTRLWKSPITGGRDD